VNGDCCATERSAQIPRATPATAMERRRLFFNQGRRMVCLNTLNAGKNCTLQSPGRASAATSVTKIRHVCSDSNTQGGVRNRGSKTGAPLKAAVSASASLRGVTEMPPGPLKLASWVIHPEVLGKKPIRYIAVHETGSRPSAHGNGNRRSGGVGEAASAMINWAPAGPVHGGNR
jgi:hypothetical protein